MPTPVPPALSRRIAAALSACLLVALSGCGDDAAESDPASGPTSESTSSSPTSQATTKPPKKTEDSQSGPTLAVEVNGDDVSPSGKTIDMAAGDVLTIRLTSDRAGELHVHSSPEQYVDFPSGKSRREVSIDKPGQVDIEEHDSGALVARLLVK